LCARLPDPQGLALYDPRCSGEHFGVLAACEGGRRGDLMEFFRKKGGEVRAFE
jgi:molybdopterin-containing oxidoreductase family membrane subunit